MLQEIVLRVVLFATCPVPLQFRFCCKCREIRGGTGQVANKT